MTETELKRFTEILQNKLKKQVSKYGGLSQTIFKPGEYGFENAIAAFVLPEGMPADLTAALIQQMRPKYPVLAFATEAWVVDAHSKEELDRDKLENHPDKIESVILVVHNHKESYFWASVMNIVGDEVFLGEWQSLDEDYEPTGCGLLSQPYQPPPEYN
jgi:hypothetical protein